MKCPSCGKDVLQPVYFTAPAPMLLDYGEPLPPRRRLAEMTCPACRACWYTMPDETPETAYARICNEELHP